MRRIVYLITMIFIMSSVLLGCSKLSGRISVKDDHRLFYSNDGETNTFQNNKNRFDELATGLINSNMILQIYNHSDGKGYDWLYTFPNSVDCADITNNKEEYIDVKLLEVIECFLEDFKCCSVACGKYGAKDNQPFVEITFWDKEPNNGIMYFPNGLPEEIVQKGMDTCYRKMTDTLSENWYYYSLPAV